MVNLNLPFVVQCMQVQDIPEVMAVEKESFPLPWSANAYRHELTQNELSHYIVLREPETPGEQDSANWFERWFGRSRSRRPALIGYGGFWIMGEEVHISTIAIRPDWRGHGLGELLLVTIIDLAISLEAKIITLEVRISNHVAQNLYRKYLFEKAGLRRHYYRDNDEDALIMATPSIESSEFKEMYQRHRSWLAARLKNLGDATKK